MASSLISSSHHIDFDSVFGIDDTGLVQMFETLIVTVLKELLGFPAVFYEAALIEFFANSSVRDGVVISTIGGTAIEISEEVFATTFELPTEGLTDFSEVPKDLVFDARSFFSVSKEQVRISCLKKEMKIQYRLLSDILAKTLYVKAGSFDAVTHNRFMLMTAITFDVKVNWSSLLFGVLLDMVTPGSRQAKGFAIQICVLLKNVPRLVLGESRAFPASRVLTEKTVHRYVTINEKVGMEETADAPGVKKTPAKKIVSTKRPVGDGEEVPIVKNKRTTKGKPVVIAQEAVPLQIVKATTDAPTEQPPAPKRKSQKRKRRLILEGDDEIVETFVEKVDQSVPEPAVEHAQVAKTADDNIRVEKVVERVDEQVPESAVANVEPVGEQPAVETVEEGTADDVDHIIQQVLGQLDSGDQPSGTDAETIPWFDLPFVLATRDSERLFETASDSEDDMDPDVGNQAFPEVGETDVILETDEEMEPVVEEQSTDEAMSLEEILMSIPVAVPLPSVGVKITKITMGKEIKILGVDERTWYLANLPQIQVDIKGKELLVERDLVKGNPVKEQILLILADIECLVKILEKVIDEVAQFFYSFSLNRLSNLKIDESYLAKEELVLTWAEAEYSFVCFGGIEEGDTSTRSYVEKDVLRSYDDTLPPVKYRGYYRCFAQCTDYSDFRFNCFQCTDSFASTVSSHIPSVAQRVPMELDQQPFLSSTSSAPDMHFDETDIAATLPSLPALSTDLSASFDDLQISLSARLDESQSDILSRLHTIEKFLRDSLQQQEETLRNLIQGARQEGRTIDDVQTLRFNEFRKGVLANSASVTADLMDIKKAVRELNAKAQAQANHNVVTDQLSELVNYINPGGNDKKGEGSSRGPQPPPDNQNRESGDAGGDTARSIVERLISADRERESRGNRSGSYKRRRY
ncbi:dystroglycan-like [Dorcoceras hygrometricum]|uniref:Dystroglycan-like n=1 Tax=Dorcoceras hygrometricum TaxID=472368 RepID=A0A2Z7AFY6_9LAMI|nr:dystroglycan-like [Dorcoceras hygrometricum]